MRTRLPTVVFVFSALSVGVVACERLDDLWNAEPDATAVDAPSTTSDGATDVAALPTDAMARATDASDAALATATDAADVADADAAPVVDRRPTITALALRTGVVEAPRANARWIGYIRAGGRVPLVRGPLGHDGCPERNDVRGSGWYEVDGGGYVCVGYLAALTATLGPRRTPVLPDLDAAMPFLYGITSRATAMYRWAPSTADERTVEPERFVPRAPASTAVVSDASVGDDATAAPATSDDASVAPTPTPAAAATPDAAVDAGPPRIEDLEGTAGGPLLRRMLARMYVSLDREVRATSGAVYWHTQSGGYVRASAMGTLRSGPEFRGVRLEGSAHLPVAFAISAVTPVYQQQGNTMRPTGRAPRLAFFQLTGDPPLTIGTETYYRTADGAFVRSRNTRVITAHAPPTDLAPGEKWIDVNLDHQSLVAYEGTTPVYVTVMSSGLRRRSLTENYETIQGGFRIQSKHVATTMDGNSNDGPYSIEDVPWVMYFEQSFALHGAFWHNGFGIVHSHGCVNLSPPDARWVFGWSEPHMPAGWHSVTSTEQRPGTRVYVHYDTQELGTRGGPARIPTH